MTQGLQTERDTEKASEKPKHSKDECHKCEQGKHVGNKFLKLVQNYQYI